MGIIQSEDFRITVIRENRKGGCEIYAVDPNGNRVWTAIPHEADTFVGFKIQQGSVICQTWNGFQLKLDILTGHLVETAFTK